MAGNNTVLYLGPSRPADIPPLQEVIAPVDLHVASRLAVAVMMSREQPLTAEEAVTEYESVIVHMRKRNMLRVHDN